MQAVQKITSVPCGAVSSDRSQMGPLLYGRLSFSAENSPSLLNVFKNLLQILQVASCETEKVHQQSQFCVLVYVSPPPPTFPSSSVFSALPPPPSIFDTLGYPAARSADLVGLVVPVRTTHGAARSTQHRGALKAIRWVEARRLGRGGNVEHSRQLGCAARPNTPCGEGMGERIDSKAVAESTSSWLLPPRPCFPQRSAVPPAWAISRGSVEPKNGGWAGGRGWRCLQGSRSGVKARYWSRPGPSQIRDGEKRDMKVLAATPAGKLD